MRTYFLRRFLLVVPTFIGITFMVFAITRFVPGGPVEQMISQAQQMNQDKMGAQGRQDGMPLSDDQIEQLKKYYDLDKPFYIAYFSWMGKVLRGDLGHSTRYGEPVGRTILGRMHISIFYGLTSLVITYLVCIPLGVFKAIKHSSVFDFSSSIVVFFAYSIPGYVLGCFLIAYAAARWDMFPLGGFSSPDSIFQYLTPWQKVRDVIHHAILPLCCYMIGSFAFMTMLMKNSLMDNLAADYIRTALAKGVSFRKAIVRHAFRNSIIPIATSFGNNISLVLAGSFLIETIFDINGMGLLGYSSVVERDYPVVMGILVFSALLQLIGNILSDLCVAVVDPRITFQ